MPFWSELRRRNVFKVAAAYAVVGWLITQIVTSVEQPLGLPSWFDTTIIVALLAGFPVALLLAWAYELTPTGIRRTTELGDNEPESPSHSGDSLRYLIIGALAVAVAFLLVDRFFLAPNARLPDPVATDRSDTAGIDAGAQADASESGRIGIAVLAFDNLSSDPEQAYFVAGLSQSIRNALRRVPELRVIDSEASFRFREPDPDRAGIAAILDVEYMLEGRVLRDGDRLRVVPELTRVPDGALLWSETFDFDYEDIFTVQDRITERVATALEASLGVLQSRVPGMTRNPDAYLSFLTAIGRLIEFTPDALRDVREGLQRAIALDPEFTVAIIRLGSVYQLMATLADDANQATEYRALRDQAYALARAQQPDSAQLLLADAQLAAGRGDWSEAARLFRATQTAEQGPDFLEAMYLSSYAAFLGRAGQFAEALPLFERARAINPLNPQIHWGIGSLQAARGEIQRGLGEIDRAIGLDDTDSILMNGNALFKALALHDRAEIERRLPPLEAASENDQDLWVTMHGLLDDPAAGLAELRRRIENGEAEAPIVAGVLAHWAGYFGDADLALELLEMIPNENGLLGLLIWEPGLSAVRQLPGFRALVERMGLVNYWREYGWPDLCEPDTNGFTCR